MSFTNPGRDAGSRDDPTDTTFDEPQPWPLAPSSLGRRDPDGTYPGQGVELYVAPTKGAPDPITAVISRGPATWVLATFATVITLFSLLIVVAGLQGGDVVLQALFWAVIFGSMAGFAWLDIAKPAEIDLDGEGMVVRKAITRQEVKVPWRDVDQVLLQDRLTGSGSKKKTWTTFLRYRLNQKASQGMASGWQEVSLGSDQRERALGLLLEKYGAPRLSLDLKDTIWDAGDSRPLRTRPRADAGDES